MARSPGSRQRSVPQPAFRTETSYYKNLHPTARGVLTGRCALYSPHSTPLLPPDGIVSTELLNSRIVAHPELSSAAASALTNSHMDKTPLLAKRMATSPGIQNLLPNLDATAVNSCPTSSLRASEVERHFHRGSFCAARPAD